jgi:hypothetical protein
MIKIKLAVLFLSLYFLTPTIFAKNQIVSYEPKIVTLTGVIKLKTFPGSPNYESVAAGDDVETCPYLFLDHPIDAVVPKNDTNPEDQLEKNVKIIQVASAGDDDNWNDKYVGQHVRVTGTLYHRLTGHHHTRVLINSTHFEIAEPKRP